jgi:hypothetical protein
LSHCAPSTGIHEESRLPPETSVAIATGHRDVIQLIFFDAGKIGIAMGLVYVLNLSPLEENAL